MARQYFDDGTWIDYGTDGAVASYSDTAGAVRAPDTSLITSFLGGIVNSVASVEAAKVTAEANARARQQQLSYMLTSQQLSAANLRPILMLGLLVAGAYAVAKLAH